MSYIAPEGICLGNFSLERFPPGKKEVKKKKGCCSVAGERSGEKNEGKSEDKSGEKRLKSLFTAEQIQQRVRQIASEIDQQYAGRSVHLVCVLKGACIFLADILRHLRSETSVDFICVWSYEQGATSSGEVRITKDLDHSIAGRDVILVEDIVDTGLTLNYLCQLLLRRNPRSLRVATLLDKPSRRIQPVKLDYVGFEIPDQFVVGYGLDYQQRYRNLPDICLLPDAVEPERV